MLHAKLAAARPITLYLHGPAFSASLTCFRRGNDGEIAQTTSNNGCFTRGGTRHFVNNSDTNKDIATKC
jgi:hypothetical protein